MKKTLKIPLIIISIIVGLCLVAAGAYMGLFAWQTRKMATLETQEVVSNVFAIQDKFVNMFVLKGTDGYITFDAGMNAKHIAQELATLNIEPQQVQAIFLTHSDSDHIAAIGLFPNATLYLSKDEEQMVNGQTPRFAVIGNRLKYPYTLFEAGQPMTVAGITVEGVSAPGHTPGSMSYLVNGNLLFVGDTMSLQDGKADIFNDFFNMDSDRQRESIKLLAGLTGIDSVFTAHYGATHDPKSEFAEWK
jgi:glyoxylase-like metal-dependent hydrolase (beta-lactamase superfamily II)